MFISIFIFSSCGVFMSQVSEMLENIFNNNPKFESMFQFDIFTNKIWYLLEKISTNIALKSNLVQLP